MIDCTAYKLEGSRPFRIKLNFFSGVENPSTVDKSSVTLVTQLSLNRLVIAHLKFQHMRLCK